MPTIGQRELLPLVLLLRPLPSLRLRGVLGRAARRGGEYHCSVNDCTFLTTGLIRTVRYIGAMANGILIADGAEAQVDAEKILKSGLSFP